jgi:Zn-dependent peptidase ImmA (M78 family)
MLPYILNIIGMSRNFVKHVGLDKKSLPVDIINIINTYGINIKYTTELGEGFDALIYCENDRIPTILANNSKPIHRMRFSLAHELGHYLIPWHYWESIRLERIPKYDYQHRRMEMEANYFAGEVLMPYEQFYPMINKPIIELTKIFEVSSQAVRKRIETINKYYRL